MKPAVEAALIGGIAGGLVGGGPIAEWARPELLNTEGRKWNPVGPVTLPPHLPSR